MERRQGPVVPSIDIDMDAPMGGPMPGNTRPGENPVPEQTFGGLTSAELTTLAEDLDKLGDVPWENKALCRDMDPVIFYPEQSNMRTFKEAARICLSCFVRADCLEATLDLEATPDNVAGYRGGANERERRKILRQRKAAKQDE